MLQLHLGNIDFAFEFISQRNPSALKVSAVRTPDRYTARRGTSDLDQYKAIE